MKTSGGYQILDLTGVTINAEAAVTFADAKKSEILRTNDKLLVITGASLGAMTVTAITGDVTDTGARDGKVYHFTVNGKGYTITTNDANITITPAV